MQKEYALIDVLRILGKWKKHILIATIVTALVAAGGSLLMPNYYKASSTFYAMNPDLANPIPLRGEDRMSQLFGTDDDRDRIFSVANSSGVFAFLIDSFQLYKHYDLDSTTSKGKKLMYSKLNKLYSTTKTRYGAIELAIEDTDPVIAQHMTIAARDYIDHTAQDIIKSSQLNLIKAKRVAVDRQKGILKDLSDSLNYLRKKYSIVDSKSQGEILAELFVNTSAKLEQEKTRLDIMQKEYINQDTVKKVKALVAGLENKKNSLSKRIDMYNEGYLPTSQVQLMQRQTSGELAQEMERLSRLENSYNAEFKAIKVVEDVELPYEKSRPRRSIIVVGYALLAAILMSMIAIFVETTRGVNWKEVYAGGK